jgi:hypothetical protein
VTKTPLQGDSAKGARFPLCRICDKEVKFQLSQAAIHIVDRPLLRRLSVPRETGTNQPRMAECRKPRPISMYTELYGEESLEEEYGMRGLG